MTSSKSSEFLLLLEGWGLFKQSYEPWGHSSGGKRYTDDEVKRKGIYHLSTLAGISDHEARVDREHKSGKLSDSERSSWMSKLNQEREHHEQEYGRLTRDYGFKLHK